MDNLVDKFDEILIGGRFATGLTPDGLDINEETIALFCEKNYVSQVYCHQWSSRPVRGRRARGRHQAIFEAAKLSLARVIIGGGDTLAAIPALGFSYSDFDFVSTGGGAVANLSLPAPTPLLEIIKNQSYARP